MGTGSFVETPQVHSPLLHTDEITIIWSGLHLWNTKPQHTPLGKTVCVLNNQSILTQLYTSRSFHLTWVQVSAGRVISRIYGVSWVQYWRFNPWIDLYRFKGSWINCARRCWLQVSITVSRVRSMISPNKKKLMLHFSWYLDSKCQRCGSFGVLSIFTRAGRTPGLSRWILIMPIATSS